MINSLLKLIGENWKHLDMRYLLVVRHFHRPIYLLYQKGSFIFDRCTRFNGFWTLIGLENFLVLVQTVEALESSKSKVWRLQVVLLAALSCSSLMSNHENGAIVAWWKVLLPISRLWPDFPYFRFVLLKTLAHFKVAWQRFISDRPAFIRNFSFLFLYFFLYVAYFKTLVFKCFIKFRNDIFKNSYF